jgi:putative ABC transport system permease protein
MRIIGHQNQFDMFRSFFRLALRNIKKYKVYSAISVISLTIGFCAYILISLYVSYEYSWDKHNVRYNRIYRVQRIFTSSVQITNGNNISPHTRGITSKLLDGKYPEIEKISLLREDRGSYISSRFAQAFWEEFGFGSDQAVFDIFTFEFISGSQNISLKEPFTMILSESMAGKLFPNELAVGKTVIIEKKYNLKVTGVYRDFPRNSSFRPSYMVSLSSYEQFEDNKNSLKPDYYTFILLKAGQDADLLESKIKGLFKSYKDFEKEELSLCPLSRIYLSFNGNRDYLVILLIYKMIGIFILLLSAFNYINLTTSHIAVRNKEVAIKKIFGGGKGALILQFQAETFITALISTGLAFLMVDLVLPLFNSIIEKQLVFSFSTQLPFMVRMIAIAIGVGFLSGLYPAIFMSGRQPLDLFKGNLFKASNDKSVTRKVLIVIQFSIAILFIILTISFNLQLSYILKKDVGFTRDNLLYTLISVSRKDANWDYLRSKILTHREILNASMSRHIPMITFGGRRITWEGASAEEVVNARDNLVSYDFIETMGMHLVSGRNFSRDFPSDKERACIINESAVRAFGWDSPLGKTVDHKYQVIGVVKDFHNNDIYNIIEPFYMVLAPDSTMNGGWSFAFRVDPDRMNKAREILQVELEEYFPADPFEIKNYDESFTNQKVINIYKTIKNLVLFFTCLNVLIAVIGLLGLVAFTIYRRTKEIGIRKIHGSTNQNIFRMLYFEYLALVLFASAIAWPAAYLLFTKLPGTYKHPFVIWPYFLASATVMAIIFITSLYHTLRAANSNPITALRYE